MWALIADAVATAKTTVVTAATVLRGNGRWVPLHLAYLDLLVDTALSTNEQLTALDRVLLDTSRDDNLWLGVLSARARAVTTGACR